MDVGATLARINYVYIYIYFLAGLGIYCISKYTDFFLFPYNVGLAQRNYTVNKKVNAYLPFLNGLNLSRVW